MLVKTRNSLYLVTGIGTKIKVTKISNLTGGPNAVDPGDEFERTGLGLKLGERMVLKNGTTTVLHTSTVVGILG